MLKFAGFNLSFPVWLTGGGGKTSLMYFLAKELKGPLLLTTTTKLAYPPREEIPFYLGQNLEQLLPVLAKEKKILAGKRVEKGKIIGFLPEEVALFYQRNRIPAIVEADGSDRRPLKIHLDYEPALPVNPESVIGVVGLSALNKPYSSEYIHRAQDLPHRLITAKVIAELVVGGKYFPPSTPNKVVFLNQVDVVNKPLLEEVIGVFKAISNLKVTYGSLKEGYILPG